MPGNGPCKKKGCTKESRGQRCHGLCWKHFKEKFPKEGNEYHNKVRKTATTCRNCGPKVLAQVTDPATGYRYCKECMKSKRLTALPSRCSLCSAAQNILTQPCSYPKCNNLALLCAVCSAQCKSIPCSVCVKRRHSHRCLLCEGALPKADKDEKLCRMCENKLHQ